MHLTVIAYASLLDWRIERAVFRVDGTKDSLSRFVRCQRREQLYWIVKDVFDQVGPLSRVDIFGHGKPGTLTLGDPGQEVVTPDETSWGLLSSLGEFLATKAELRLLGCEVAACEEGRRVLKGLEARLSEGDKPRTVWGITASIAYSDFGPGGIREDTVGPFLKSAANLDVPLEGVRRLGFAGPGIVGEVQGVMQRLPPGYVSDGYQDMPAAIVDEHIQVDELDITLCAARRIIAVRSRSSHQFAIYRWLGMSEAPSSEQLKAHLLSR
ncbi:DUF4347 domain-containing protein [Myxococcus sp. CA040A]|uniref:DUF4347 domain-containing protein n=1 Tax=Myxococcus sp. CA040A TaxID=2741738 RepID=UPI00157B67DF|nr:DUF4347 domain-containing protein [Myxococcus sp. CA040A]NTX04625.1 DUF4347 domain-containing protein [Myxococcus sp. CA040A]